MEIVSVISIISSISWLIRIIERPCSLNFRISLYRHFLLSCESDCVTSSRIRISGSAESARTNSTIFLCSIFMYPADTFRSIDGSSHFFVISSTCALIILLFTRPKCEHFFVFPRKILMPAGRLLTIPNSCTMIATLLSLALTGLVGL